MPVSLKIVSFKGLPYDGEAVIIDREGGSIGRLDSCDLVLPDKEKIVSRHHATVSYETDAFILSDTSLGGTYIDDRTDPISNSSVALVDGMLLRIGEYQIQVNLLPESSEGLPDFPDNAVNGALFSETDRDPFDEDNALLNPPENTEQMDSFLCDNPFVTEKDNPLSTDHQDSGVPSNEPSENFSTLHDSFIPPSPAGERHANNEMPDDFNFEELFNPEPAAPESQSAEPVVEPVQHDNALLDGGFSGVTDESLPLPDVSETGTENLANGTADLVTKQPDIEAANLYKAFLHGAELQQADIQASEQEDRMRRIGSMLRQFVESTVAVLRSRAEFKSLFRVTVTTIKRADNNPLKFSVTPDEALQHLLNDGQGGFKKSVEAIDEGFQDILNHQMAMQAGIQASLQEILSQFEPDRIEKKFGEGLVLNKKAKCWDRYCEVYARLAENAVEDFYGDAFSDAYEQQMKQIMAVNQKK